MTAEELEEIGLIAIIRSDFESDLAAAARALADGGVRAMEITLNTPGALLAISEIKSMLAPSLRVGAGTILDVSDAEAAFSAGAEFIVTPTLQPDSIAFCKQHSLPIACGCFTPTEALAAHRAGADFIKLFPADTLGPGYMRALLAPLPFLKIIPTGGVSIDNLPAYIEAGCAGAAIGNSLVSKKRLKEGDWIGLTNAAREYVDVLAAARAKVKD
jgi:2-dehydro-3-deoxyphosphogluconate aldolase/(4S)-4-hydroxy-2-oxoglutarate aldolase